MAKLLDDDPELLRLAERVAMLADHPRQTPQRASRWFLVVPTAVCAAGAVAAGILLSGGHGIDLTGRALAAVGADPVLHAVLVGRVDTDRTVQLATGKRMPTRVTLEFWFDEARGRLRVVERRNGAIASDAVWRTFRASGDVAGPEPGLTRVLLGYRRALRTGRVTPLSTGTVGGRNVRWLSLSPASPPSDRIAIDARDFLPVVIEAANGTRWTVSQIGSQHESASVFRPHPPSASGPSSGRVIGARPVGATEVAHLLAARALRLERSSLRSAEAQLQRIKSTFPSALHRRPIVSSGLSIRYRTATGAVVIVQAARRPLPAYGYFGGRTFASDPIPREGAMQLTAVGAGWLGQLHSHGWYLSIAGPDPASVIGTAQRLRALDR
ncbi:MAG: hypothetical protein ACYDCH_10545 [Gaiellaceae bacterium]